MRTRNKVRLLVAAVVVMAAPIAIRAYRFKVAIQTEHEAAVVWRKAMAGETEATDQWIELSPVRSDRFVESLELLKTKTVVALELSEAERLTDRKPPPNATGRPFLVRAWCDRLSASSMAAYQSSVDPSHVMITFMPSKRKTRQCRMPVVVYTNERPTVVTVQGVMP